MEATSTHTRKWRCGCLCTHSSREDWDPDDFLGNEALVDNWEAIGVIVPDEDYDDMIEVFDELYDTTGKEYKLYKASFRL